ncbi:MAG: NTP transferase domain-containing protein, partial [Mariprofundaceae bacterium]|nr:NTP transferase domain-containing protein [Mariprofundaceae bacterium]
MKDQGPTKPLVYFLGISLLERTMRTLARAGITRAVVVAGHKARTVRCGAERFATEVGLELQVVEAEDWRRGNGASALAARDAMGERFLMVMCDHLFEPEILQRLASHRPPANGVLLAIDRRRDNPLVDHDDVTRVCIQNGHITAIGKGLSPFDAYDTGAFHCTRGLFDALTRADGTVSDAIQRLANEGRARIWNIGDGFWIDLDDAAAMRRAEAAMLRQAAGKAHDGPVARWLNRPVSRWLSRYAMRYGLTPMQLSWMAFALSLLAASLIALPFAWSIAV